ncbi:MAG TPA: tetratricopeptide repeat protein [Rhizomicrobium sp.]|jgi:tetratricopeptide (TPR) repeat protein
MTNFGKAVAMLAALCAFAGTPAFADSVATSSDGGFGRIVFTFDPAAHVSAQMTSGVVTVTADRKIAIDPAAISSGFDAYVSTVRLDPSATTLRIALAQDAKLHTSISANRFAVDLVPPSFAGMPANLPPPAPKVASAVDVAKLPPLSIRAGAYANFSRIVFDWTKTVPYTIAPGSGHLTIRFEAAERPDFSAFERIAPPWVKLAGWRVENGGTVVEFTADPGSRYHDFRDGAHVVLDILSPKSDADAYKPPGDKGGVAVKSLLAANTPTKADAAKPDAAKAAAAAQALIDAQNKPQTAATTPAQPDTQAQTADATSQTPAPTPISAGGTRTRDGAVIMFANAAYHPTAVFERGATVWIVLDGAPPIDIEKLRAALGDFPAALDVSSANGTSLVRVTLKQPEAVSADAMAGNLKVTIAPQIGKQPIAIGFVRNDDAPNGAYLTTLVPGALRAITMADPTVGDTLVVIPAIPGRGMVAQKSFVDFNAIPTAAGLVIAPLADDVAVAVNQSRIRIGRPNGLVLNANIAVAAQSPSDLTRPGDGPTFIDFQKWAKAPGKGFLDSERRLRAMITKQKPQDVNHARLVLARFYVANQFAAEALGLVDLMQATDPTLQGDSQLQMIRAASDFMMGRYNDAHNILSASAFDNDPHAAYWRGLTAAALGDETGARQSLMIADPVLSHYPTDWQSRARIAEAEVALAAGSLESADAALSRLPRDLPKPLLLDSEIARAKLYARENRQRDAFALFDAVENSGDDSAAARAIYAHVEAGLQTKTMPVTTAIDMLEKLRYRWRGDALELNTLRKLGALYFQTQHWRDGLQTLRVAAQNFPEDESARHANDDMRAAFVQLYLKGAADKMSPVQALALFYDFIDLTPIGPDGDEMIRRMADRLMAVDLLGPAAKLLDYQVTKRLDGVAQAQVAAKLAMIQLLDHKPKDALASIRNTRVAGLPDDVNHERMILEARSLAALKQWDMALDTIAVDEAPDSQRLRADIYWESGNWPVAGQKAEELLGDGWNNATPLSDDDRHEVMRAAIAYSLANDEPSLDRLRDHFMAKMKASKDSAAFTVVTQNISAQGAAFRDQAGQVASIDTLEAFMKDFKKRYDNNAVN